MDVQSNQKRQREITGEIDDDDEVDTNTPKRMKANKTEKDKVDIISLNDDCLEEIFKFLELTDLIEVINTNKHFSTSVCSVFRRKYGIGTIKISNSLTPVKSNQSTHETELYSQMLLFPLAVKTMRHFGHLITKMQVRYYLKYRRVDHYMEDAIIKYCRKSLVEISFINADYFTLFQITKPFPNALKVSFNVGTLCKLISNFNKWFPRAERFDLIGPIGLKSHYKNLLAQHFPKLRHLGVTNTTSIYYKVNETNEIMSLGNKYLLEAIDFNPQLNSLTIEHLATDKDINVEGKLLATINTKLPELTDLRLHVFNYHPAYTSDQVNFKRLKRLSFDFDDSRLLSKMAISANELEYIELTADDFGLETKLGRECLTFLQQFRSVKILIIRGEWETSKILIDTMISFEKLPSLSQLIIDTTDVAIETEPIVNMVNNCKSLKKLHIFVDVKYKEEFVDRYKHVFNQVVASVGTGCISKVVTYDHEHFEISLKISKN